MKCVMIAEKPSVAREYVKALQLDNVKKEEGYTEGVSKVDGNTYQVTWSYGHLVTLSYPQVYNEKQANIYPVESMNLKSWSMDVLPFLPEDYLYEAIGDTVKQFKVVKKLYNSKDVDRIYYAGDSGREGIYIQMLIRMLAGTKSGVDEKVVWIDSQTEDEIKRGIREAKPLSEYSGLIDAAYMRGIEDYSIGINFSRALTTKFGNQFFREAGLEKRAPIAVGRVMTCVLGMIVRREREIRDFKETVFYKPVADCGTFNAKWKCVEGSMLYGTSKLYKDEGILDKDEADRFVANLNGDKDLQVEKLEKKQEKKAAPLLYNLAEIQADCSKKFKLSPDETLLIIQGLYEAKIVTYPRTDARVLSTAIAGEIIKNIKGLAKGSYLADKAQYIIDNNMWHLSKGRYVDDSKITDHYAIIPTGEGNASSLTGMDKTVYELIVRRFLSIFYPPAVYDKVSLVLKHTSNDKFFASEKMLVAPGYLEVAGGQKEKDDDESDGKIPSTLKQGDIIDASFFVQEGKTQPPKRYTSGSIILAMENAGNLIDDEELRAQIKSCGIGTSATRGGILTKLVKNGYIALDKKSQVLSPKKAGEVIYDIVEDTVPALLSPEMTASWEKGLSQIEENKISKDQYQGKLYDYIRSSIEIIRNKEASGAPEYIPTGIACPFCGKEIVKTMYGYKCSGYAKEGGCGYYVYDCKNDPVTEDDIRQLSADGKTRVIQGFKSKGGKSYDAFYELDMTEQKVVKKFPEPMADDTGIECPFCGKGIIHTKFGYKCSDYNKDGGCAFNVYDSEKDKLSEDDIRQLCSAGASRVIKGFKAKSGKSYDAYYVIDETEKKVNRAFPEYEAEQTKYKCPDCGSPIVESKYNYQCSSCSFKLPIQLCGHTFTKIEVGSLIESGAMASYAKFKGKKGPFEAKLVRQDDGGFGFEFKPRSKD